MKSAALLLCVIVCAMASLSYGADRPQVRSVYLLPMSNGLDQYLANRLAASGLYQVIVDPKKAEAIFTDKLGEAFESRLDEFFPPAQVKKSESENAKDLEKESNKPLLPSSFGRAKGTLFLVETATRNVVWSIYEPPKNTTPLELDRAAQRIVERLKSPSKGK